MRRQTALLILGVGTVAALFLVNLIWLYPATDTQRVWLSSTAALDGVSPYLTTAQLADIYHPEWGYSMDLPSPRTPGALMLTAPLTLVDFYQAPEIVRVLSVFALAVIVWVAYRLTSRWWVLAGMPLLALSLPMFSAYNPANTAIIVAAMVAVSYVAPPKVRGVLLGLAAMLKLWPALIFLAYRDRDTWRSGVLTVAVVEGVGWLIIRPTVGEVAGALFSGGSDAMSQSGNASLFGLPLPVWLLTLVAAGMLVAAVRTRRFLPIAATAVMIAPLSWPAYHAFLYPWLVRHPWLLAGWFVYPLAWDYLGLITLAVVAMVWVLDLRAGSGRRVADVEEYRPAVAGGVG